MTAVSPRPRQATGGRGSFTPIHLAVAASLAANVLVQMTEFLTPLASVVAPCAKVGTTIQALVTVVGSWGLWNRRGQAAAEP